MANSEYENVMDASQKDVAFLRKEFNRNRKIVLKKFPGNTVEVMK